ncbi:MAG: hypothetical protein M3460_30410 [Actinomycetota bacterium]|nr:hypothetical protein [Actinomycetota bacterium]
MVIEVPMSLLTATAVGALARKEALVIVISEESTALTAVNPSQTAIREWVAALASAHVTLQC